MKKSRLSKLGVSLIPHALRKRVILQGIECILHIERSAATNWWWLAAASAKGVAKVHGLYEFEQEPEEAMKWAYVIAGALTRAEGPEYPLDYHAGWAESKTAWGFPTIQ